MSNVVKSLDHSVWICHNYINDKGERKLRSVKETNTTLCDVYGNDCHNKNCVVIRLENILNNYKHGRCNLLFAVRAIQEVYWTIAV